MERRDREGEGEVREGKGSRNIPHRFLPKPDSFWPKMYQNTFGTEFRGPRGREREEWGKRKEGRKDEGKG